MANRLAQTSAKRVGLGFALAGLAQLLSLFLAGAGEGWNTPFFMSLMLWLLLPAVTYLAWRVGRTGLGKGVTPFLLAVVAVAADAMLINGTLDEAKYLSHYVEVNGALGMLFILAWLALWFSWQVAVGVALATRGRRSDADA